MYTVLVYCWDTVVAYSAMANVSKSECQANHRFGGLGLESSSSNLGCSRIWSHSDTCGFSGKFDGVGELFLHTHIGRLVNL